jgi:hypothetical protein
MTNQIGNFFSLLSGAQIARIRGKPSYHFMEKTFTPHYESHILPDVQVFELNRMRALRECRSRAWISIILGPIVIAATIFLAFKYMNKVDDLPFFIIFITIGGLGAWATRPVKKYKSSVKAKVFPKVFSFFGPEYRYSETGQMTVGSLQSSGIIPKHDNSYTEDYVKGIHKDVTIEFTEAKMTETRGSGKRRRTVTVFKGMFILLSMNKNFKGQTIVKRDSGMIGNWFTDKFNKLENVRLEDPVFEKQFQVYSNDQIEARYLLTTSFMERVLDLSRRFGDQGVQFSFYNNKLLLMVSSQKNWFETSSIFVPATFVNDINDIILQMRTLFKIIEVLKLEERTGI